MTGDESQFITLKAKNGGMVTFEDDGKGKIISIDNIDITFSTCIKNILLLKESTFQSKNISITPGFWMLYA